MHETLITFFVSVMASIVSYFICKWLDGNDRQKQPERYKPPYINGIKTPGSLDHFWEFCFAHA